MATKPSVLYPGQTDITDLVGYPWGAAQNDVVIGDGQGTPLERGWVKDLFGFEQALLAAAGITPDGLQEKVGASQYVTAILSLATTISDARSRIALQKSQAVNWPERTTYANGSPVNSAVPIAYDPYPSSQGFFANTGIFMCVTANTMSVTSDDGTFWRNGVSFGGILGGAAYDLAAGLSGGARAFLASRVGTSDFMRTTDGGTTWTLFAGGLPGTSSGVLCNGPGSVWVAFGAFGAVVRSTDGLTFSNAGVTISGFGVNAKRVVWNGAKFVAIGAGTGNKVASSPDGLTWTVSALPSVQTWMGLAYSATEGLWMAVALSGVVATSPDGIAWTTVAAVASMVDLAVLGSLWVGPILSGQQGGINYSTDRGVTWKQVAVGDHRTASGWDRIIAADNRFVVVKANGAALEFALSQRTNS